MLVILQGPVSKHNKSTECSQLKERVNPKPLTHIRHPMNSAANEASSCAWNALVSEGSSFADDDVRVSQNGKLLGTPRNM